jgi:hypothetical protein
LARNRPEPQPNGCGYTIVDHYLGYTVVDPGYGRMRCDATDARAYDCTGLMGLQWQTNILFCDDHVTRMERIDLIDDTPAAKRQWNNDHRPH